MHFSLILATIPCLEPFIRPFEAEGKLVEPDEPGEQDNRGGSVSSVAHTPDSGLGFMFRKQHQDPEREDEHTERRKSRLSWLSRKQDRTGSSTTEDEGGIAGTTTKSTTPIGHIPPSETPEDPAINPYYAARHFRQPAWTSEETPKVRPTPNRRITEQDYRMMGIPTIRDRARAASWAAFAMDSDDDEDRGGRVNSDNTLVNEGVDVVDTQWQDIDLKA